MFFQADCKKIVNRAGRIEVETRHDALELGCSEQAMTTGHSSKHRHDRKRQQRAMDPLHPSKIIRWVTKVGYAAVEKERLNHKEHGRKDDSDAKHRVHPPKARIDKPVPHMTAIDHPEAAHARQQHPNLGLRCETSFKLVKSAEPPIRRMSMGDGRHYQERNKRHASNPQQD